MADPLPDGDGLDWCEYCCSHHSPGFPCPDESDWLPDDVVDLADRDALWYADMLAIAEWQPDPHTPFRGAN
jgi:hypothetical protein